LGHFPVSPYNQRTSFDYLVGAGEQLRWYGEAEHPGSLGIGDQLELGRPFDRW
jgi:hypothetical protein